MNVHHYATSGGKDLILDYIDRLPKNEKAEGLTVHTCKKQKGKEVVVYAGESKTQKNKEVIVAEIFPDFDALKARGIKDVNHYFDSEIKKVNSRMVSYKSVKLVKIRHEEFKKNTSRKILRFVIDKSID